MRERVFVRRGKKPILLVAPHGADDTNTVILAKHAAELLDCSAVINQGFERCDKVDTSKDLADCNRIDHVKEDVIFDEFLKPIISIRDAYRRKLTRGNPWAHLDLADALLICHIHGVGDAVHKEANERVMIVVGYGKGHTKDEISCQLWRKNLFIDLMRKYATDGDVFEGKGGGKYAGRSSNNVNQYFRKHESDAMVDSLQLEFPFSTRNTEEKAKLTGGMLAVVLNNMLKRRSYDKVPAPKFI